MARKTADAKHTIARSDMLFQPLFTAAESDQDYQSIINAIKRDMVYKNLTKDHPGKHFGKLAWDQLAILDEEPNTLVIFVSNKVVIPKSERSAIMKTLHVSHGKAESTIVKAILRFTGCI